MTDLSPDAQSALDVCKLLLSSIKVGGAKGREMFGSTLHPSGHMAHARSYRGAPLFFHSFFGELQDYVQEAWQEGSDMQEAIDEGGQAKVVVLVDHDIATVWTPYWFRKNGQLTHVGTNSFGLIKVFDEQGHGDSHGWEWKIVVAHDTGRLPTDAERKRLDDEYKSKSSHKT